MLTYGRANVAFVRGKGSWLYTEDDTAYLDCATGIAVNVFKYGDKRLVAALHAQADKLWHTSNLYRISEQEKARRLTAMLAWTMLFCNSGQKPMKLL